MTYDLKFYCGKHRAFKPCQECAKGGVWDGEALIFKKDAQKRITELEGEIQRLKQALEKYGNHLDWCALMDSRPVNEFRDECTCGLEQALEN